MEKCKHIVKCIELYIILKWNAYVQIVVKIKYSNIENFGLVQK